MKPIWTTGPPVGVLCTLADRGRSRGEWIPTCSRHQCGEESPGLPWEAGLLLTSSSSGFFPRGRVRSHCLTVSQRETEAGAWSPGFHPLASCWLRPALSSTGPLSSTILPCLSPQTFLMPPHLHTCTCRAPFSVPPPVVLGASELASIQPSLWPTSQ